MEPKMKILTLLLISLHQLGNSFGSSDIEKGEKMVKGLCSALICKHLAKDSPFDDFLTKDCCLDSEGLPSCCRRLKDWVIGFLAIFGGAVLISAIAITIRRRCNPSRNAPAMIIATQSPPQTSVLINAAEPPARIIA